MVEFFDQAKPILSFLQWAVAIAAAVFMLWMRSMFVARSEFNALSKLVTGLEARCDRMNDRMSQSPTSKELHDLQLGIERLNGQLAVHSERMEGFEDLHAVIKRQVEVMDEWMRDQK